MVTDFKSGMRQMQIDWRNRAGNVSTREAGKQNGKHYNHVLPYDNWKENLWPKIQEDLPNYLDEHEIHHHTGVHNLLSSWIACANLYFPFRRTESGKELLGSFLQKRIDSSIVAVRDIELEWEGEKDTHPSQLLGEKGGMRGAGQTSPDVAFLVRARQTSGGKVEEVDGIVLVESKLTEHSFYRCSARTKKKDEGRVPNPNPKRCLDVGRLLLDRKAVCHQIEWGRKYWNYLVPKKEKFEAKGIRWCPAATAGYQLFRQQALAEGLVKKGMKFVLSCVAYDKRNTTLTGCMRRTGLKHPEELAGLFETAVKLKFFSHQQWWDFVRENGGEDWRAWASWIEDRYGFVRETSAESKGS